VNEEGNSARVFCCVCWKKEAKMREKYIRDRRSRWHQSARRPDGGREKLLWCKEGRNIIYIFIDM